MSSLAAASSTKITLETKRAFRRRRRCRHRCCWACATPTHTPHAVAAAQVPSSNPNNDNDSNNKHNFRLRTRRFLCANWQPLGSTYNCSPLHPFHLPSAAPSPYMPLLHRLLHLPHQSPNLNNLNTCALALHCAWVGLCTGGGGGRRGARVCVRYEYACVCLCFRLRKAKVNV